MEGLDFPSLRASLAGFRPVDFPQRLHSIEQGSPSGLDPRGRVQWLSDALGTPYLDCLEAALAQGGCSLLNEDSFFKARTGLLSFIAQSAQSAPSVPPAEPLTSPPGLVLRRGEILYLLCNIFLGASPILLPSSLPALQSSPPIDLSRIDEYNTAEDTRVFQMRCLLAYFLYMKENPGIMMQDVSFSWGADTRGGTTATEQVDEIDLQMDITFVDTGTTTDLVSYECGEGHAAWIVPCQAVDTEQDPHHPEAVQMFLSPEALLVHYLREQASRAPGVIAVQDVLVTSCTPISKGSGLQCNPLRTPLSRRSMALLDARVVQDAVQDPGVFSVAAQELANALAIQGRPSRVHVLACGGEPGLSVLSLFLQWQACSLAGGAPMTIHHDPSCPDIPFQCFRDFIEPLACTGTRSSDSILDALEKHVGSGRAAPTSA